MTPFFTLDTTYIVCLASFSLILASASIYIFIKSCFLGLKTNYLIGAGFLAAFCILLFQGTSNSFKVYSEEALYSVYVDLLDKIPWFAYAVSLMLLSICTLFFSIRIRKVQRETLTPESVRESIDFLPDGVCFSDIDGTLLLTNVKMNLLCVQLFGTGLLNACRFWDDLKSGNGIRSDIIRKEPTLTVKMPDGTVWDFRRTLLTVEESKIFEIIAYDVTAQYLLNRELIRRNERLNSVSKRLRAFGSELERITREKEILAAKVKVHNDAGRSLLALRSYLAHPKEERDRKELIPIWQYVVTVMLHSAGEDNKKNKLEEIIADARAVGVNVILSGSLTHICDETLPDADGKKTHTQKILFTALKECVNNTVKHAGGDTLRFTVRESENIISAEYTNNGTPPCGPIIERGGLKNLRQTVEKAGGRMMSVSSPEFILRIELPK